MTQADLNDAMVRLKRVSVDDCKFLYNLRLERHVQLASRSDVPFTYESHKDWLARTLDDPQRLNWVILFGDFRYGTCSLKLAPDGKEAEFSISLAREAVGKGIGQKALGLLLAAAFGPLGLERVTGETMSHNTQARMCFAKLGFNETGTTPNAYVKNGAPVDGIHLVLTAEQWRSRSKS